MKTSIKLSRSSGCYILILLIIILEHYFLYLIPQNFTIIGLGIIDICTIFEVFLFLSVLVSGAGKMPKSKYSWMVYSGLLIVCTSAIAGMITYDQSFLDGIVVQRYRIGSLLLYFVMLVWYRKHKINENGLIKVLNTFVCIYLAICCVQYLLSGIVTFTYTGAEGITRYGAVRYWFSGIYLVFVAGYWADGIFNEKKKNFKYVLGIALAFIFFFIIVKTRMLALAFTGAVAICFVVHKGSTNKKMFAIVAVFIVIITFASTNIGEDVLNILMGGGASTEDTLTVRTMGRAYYVGQTFENPIRAILGCGYATANNSMALRMTYPSIYSSSYGYAVALYPQDNGVFGLFYYYGIIGIIWWLASMLFTFVKARKIYKCSGEFMYIFILLFDMVSCITSFPIMLGRMAIAPIIWVMLESKENSITKQHVKKGE